MSSQSKNFDKQETLELPNSIMNQTGGLEIINEEPTEDPKREDRNQVERGSTIPLEQLDEVRKKVEKVKTIPISAKESVHEPTHSVVSAVGPLPPTPS